MEIIKEKWQEILQRIKTEHELTHIAFKTWLQPLSVYKVEDSVVTVIVSSQQVGTIEYLEKKYTLPLKVAIAEVTGHDYEVRFVTEENSDIPSKFSKPLAKPIAGLNPRYTFDTFVVGKNNEFAHAASLAVAESPGTVYNPLFLYGGVGLGKTHLMHSIAYYILQQHPEMNILYVTSEQFTNEVIDAIRIGNNSPVAISRFREKYRNIDVLLVDDIQFIIGKESTQEEFFHTFNSLHGAGKQIILSSDRPPKDMNLLEERIRSRFEMGLMADIQRPDFETRIAILQKKQELDGFYIDIEIIKYIAENIKSNIRELEGSMNRVIALANIKKCAIDIPLVKEALKDIISTSETKKITPDMIIQEVSSYFNISTEDIKSKKRSSNITHPRHIAMYLMRELTDSNLQKIANFIGVKDHTTVISAIKKIEKAYIDDPEVKNDVDNIKNRILG